MQRQQPVTVSAETELFEIRPKLKGLLDAIPATMRMAYALIEKHKTP
jgi:hypothetical protein